MYSHANLYYFVRVMCDACINVLAKSTPILADLATTLMIAMECQEYDGNFLWKI